MQITIDAERHYDLLGDEYLRSDPYKITISDNCNGDYILCTFDGIGDIFIKRSDLTAALKAFQNWEA